MSKVRIGFVGVGGMGQMAHLKNYVSVGDCEVVAIAELREEIGRRVAQRYNIPKVYPNFEEMLANEKVDALVASQPYSRHGVLLPDLFRAGVPVLTEKPLGRSVPVGEAILESARKNNARYYVGYHKRSDPAVMYAKSEILRLQETGELGKMRYVRITMPPGDWVAGGFDGIIMGKNPEGLQFDAPDPDMDQGTYFAYDAFVNYYIHQVNLMRHLLGEDYEVTYAEPSSVLLALRSASGVAGVIEMAPYSTSIAWQEEALVAFDRGYVRVALPAPLAQFRCGEVTLYRDPNGGSPCETRPQLPWVHAFRQQAINFVDAVQGKPTPLCGPEDALKDLRVARDYIRMKNR